MTLGQAKPTFQIEIVLDLLEHARADKEASAKAPHDFGHLLMRRIRRARETFLQGLETFLPFRARSVRHEGRCYLRDVLDVAAQRCLLRADAVQAAIDAARQSLQLLRCEPPFFSSRFRWIDSRTSPNASAIRRPEGCSGPP